MVHKEGETCHTKKEKGKRGNLINKGEEKGKNERGHGGSSRRLGKGIGGGGKDGERDCAVRESQGMKDAE